MKSSRIFAVLALTVASTAVWAQEGTVRVGGTARSGNDNSSKLEQFTVVPDGEAFFGLDLSFDAGHGNYFTIVGNHLFVGDERARAQFGKRAGWRVGLYYDRNQNWISSTAVTAFSYAGSGRYLVDDTLQSTIETAGNAAAWELAADPFDLRYKRKKAGADFHVPFLDDAFALSGYYETTARDGWQPYAFALFRTRNSAAAAPDQRIFEFPAHLDDRTKDARVALEYARGPLFLSASGMVSRFENSVDKLTLDNPTRLTAVADGPTIVQGAWWPDNRAAYVDLQGAYRLGKEHRISAQFSKGRMRQDEDLLPYSPNDPLVFADVVVPGFSVWSPYTAVDAKIDTTAYALKFVGSPGKWGYEVAYRVYDLDNKTPLYTFTAVPRMDTHIETLESYSNVAADWRKESLRASGRYDVTDWLRLGLGVTQTDWERPTRRIKENGVTALRGSADIKFSHWLHGRLTYVDESQDIDSEIETPDPAEGEDPRNRQFDIAERDSKRWEAHLGFSPFEHFEFAVFGASGDNKFPSSQVGLRKEKYENVGFDVGYEFAEGVSLFANWVEEKFKWDHTSSFGTNFTPAGDADLWSSRTRDSIKTWQFGVNVEPSGRVAFGVDYTKTNGTSDQACIFVPGGALQADCRFPTTSSGVQYPGWPTVTSDLSWLRAHGKVDLSDRLALGVEVAKYQYDGEDWALDFVDVYMNGAVENPTNSVGLRNSVFLDLKLPDFDADVYTVYLDAKF